MSLYDNILTGMNTFSKDWLILIEQINKENLIIFDFNNDNLQNIIIEKNIAYILPLSEKDYLIIKTKINNTNIILYPTIEIFNLLNNKLLFAYFMLEYFIDYIPNIYYLNNVQLLDIEYPIISKPIYSTNGKNMKIYHTDTDFLQCKSKIIIQQYIEDEYEYGAFMLCINGKL